MQSATYLKEIAHPRPALCQEQHNGGNAEGVLVVLVGSGLRAPAVTSRERIKCLCSRFTSQ